MGWLKEEIEQVRQTVAGWPAWKRGEGRMVTANEIIEVKEEWKQKMLECQWKVDREPDIDRCSQTPDPSYLKYIEKLEAALKAKDEKLTELAHAYTNQRIANRDLLDQTIRFADLYLRKLETTHGMNAHKIPAYHEATDFLTRPEVQARRKV